MGHTRWMDCKVLLLKNQKPKTKKQVIAEYPLKRQDSKKDSKTFAPAESKPQMDKGSWLLSRDRSNWAPHHRVGMGHERSPILSTENFGNWVPAARSEEGKIWSTEGGLQQKFRTARSALTSLVIQSLIISVNRTGTITHRFR